MIRPVYWCKDLGERTLSKNCKSYEKATCGEHRQIFPLVIECDNKARCHTPKTIAEDQNAMRVICTTCWHKYVIRKDPYKGNPEKKQYAKIFKKDILQGNDNLFYKYNPQHLRV